MENTLTDVRVLRVNVMDCTCIDHRRPSPAKRENQQESRSAAVEVSLNGDTGDDETSSLFGEASKFHKPGEYTVDQDTGHIIWFVISFSLICFQP